MFLVLQVVSVFFVSVAMALALAHALELPGKLRLDKQTYLAVQAIYYPGFTIGGLFGEALGMVSTLVLLLMTPARSSAFWWTLAGLAALLAMHAVYWIVTHPVNNFWLQDQKMNTAGAKFFGVDRGERTKDDGADLWKRYRDRWEYSHVLRAVLSTLALLALIIAVALPDAPTPRPK